MKALVWEAPRNMAMRDWPEPKPLEDEVVIEVAYVGICGSELGGYLGHNALRVPPLVMGHEFSGTIISVGKQAGDDLFVGQPVTCNPMISCGTCVHCRSAAPHLCLSRSLVGAHRPGAFAQQVAVPGRAVHALPDGMDLSRGALVEPAAVAMRIGKLAGGLLGRTVLVIGAGPIGLLGLQVMQQLGAARLFISDLDRERLAMGEALGATPIDPSCQDPVTAIKESTGGVGAHVTLDAVGSAATRAQAVAATRSSGKVLLSGLHEETSQFQVSDVIRREIEVRGVFCYDEDDFLAATEALGVSRLRLDPWIVEAPLSEGGAWFERLVGKPGAVSKVLLKP
ncbi:alcohol dehydrogenase catalytic domain-containing protein [Chelativorans sp. Marseille-P2723]|uniref:alcohol dehydrogenase catalytic domain-containing protein n=1 Tax=Chelativorans sp. Marseille-P2723 TaxID=2709133 RepID=UPI0015715C49|nr:alcohol dehydrogenase catalytic domain-containing protein [Chelativorans sp. Marseille-P2723]